MFAFSHFLMAHIHSTRLPWFYCLKISPVFSLFSIPTSNNQAQAMVILCLDYWKVFFLIAWRLYHTWPSVTNVIPPVACHRCGLFFTFCNISPTVSCMSILSSRLYNGCCMKVSFSLYYSPQHNAWSRCSNNVWLLHPGSGVRQICVSPMILILSFHIPENRHYTETTSWCDHEDGLRKGMLTT